MGAGGIADHYGRSRGVADRLAEHVLIPRGKPAEPGRRVAGVGDEQAVNRRSVDDHPGRCVRRILGPAGDVGRRHV